ncbi:MAG: InlB B-repeat-containing protein, partial [Candidatus Ventricola sp.]
GWYDNSACTGTPITEIANDANTAKTFWAKWTPDTYNLTLITNGGTIKSGDLNSYTYGEGATLPTDVTRAGYAFAGWYDNETLTGDPVTAIGTTETGAKEYWAKWVVVLTDPDGEIVIGDAAFAKLPPVTVPTLVLPEGTTLGGSVMLKYVKVDTTRENTAVYDVYLVDQDGNRVKLPAACTLCLPYPEGLNQSSASAYRIHILHEMDGGRSEDFDSVSGGLELTPQGLCVRISSLSPFTITWERFPEVNLPQTGDSSHPGLWLALGLASIAALAALALRGRKSRAH